MPSGLTLHMRKVKCLYCFTDVEAVNTNWKIGSKEMHYTFIHMCVCVCVCVYTYMYNT
jgi:hypothetical protein